MYNNIIIPLDGSPLSEAVLPWAKAVVEKLAPGAVLTLLRTFEPPSTVYLLPELAVPTTHAISDEYLSGLIAEYLQARSNELGGFRVQTSMTLGDPATEILNASDEADLVIMASHGRGGLGRWLMGSVTTKVVRGSTTPTMVVGSNSLEAHPEKVGRLKKFLAGYDGSEVSERAFFTACDLARRVKGSVHLYTAVTPVELAASHALEMNRATVEYFQDRHQSLMDQVDDLDLYSTVEEADDAPDIAETAEEWGADLVVIGSHGQGGFRRWAIGGQTERTIQYAGCPVLITH